MSRVRARRRRRILLALLTGASGLDFVNLARLAQVSGLALATHLDRLEADGWVVRHRTIASHRPARVYRLTADGMAGARRELGLSDEEAAR